MTAPSLLCARNGPFIASPLAFAHDAHPPP
jgi:hypothetical protein